VGRILDVDEVDAALKEAAAQAINGTREERSGRILITGVEYDDNARELWVTFADGRTYHYRSVPPEVYEDLLAAEPKGEFFNNRIRGVFALAER
jgi:hypothetical protein